jgi:hypothetical protein
MEKVLILGANPKKYGFGSHLIEKFNKLGYEVDHICRSDVNLNDEDWFSKVFTGKRYDIIIINVFDKNSSQTQLNVFNKVYQELKDDEQLNLVVIGSYAHYYGINASDYHVAKYLLNRRFHEFIGATNTFKCKMVLLEPGYLENFLSRPDRFPFMYSTFEQTSDVLINLIKMNLKALQVSLKGAEFSPPKIEV